MDHKKNIGKKVIYKNSDGKSRIGFITEIGFHNKDFSVCWYSVKFEHTAFLVSKHKVTIIEDQLNLFQNFPLVVSGL